MLTNRYTFFALDEAILDKMELLLQILFGIQTILAEFFRYDFDEISRGNFKFL